MRSAILAFALVIGCSAPKDERVPVDVPDRAQFPKVADAIAPHCATLDCHGQVGRNFRFYWERGLRLGNGVPGQDQTTVAEYDETFRSLVALEPFLITKVVDGSASPEQLTIVRKARGTENHKGGAQLPIGSDADRCLVTWLAGAIDTNACKNATKP